MLPLIQVGMQVDAKPGYQEPLVQEKPSRESKDSRDLLAQVTAGEEGTEAGLYVKGAVV